MSTRNAGAQPPTTAPLGQAVAHVLPDPATKGQSRAAQLAARTTAWRGQASDPTMRQQRTDTWRAGNPGV